MNKFTKPKLNSECVIISPEFHDADLNKIELLPGKKAKILLKTVTNLVFEIVFNDIEYLNCVNFKEGNIVFDVVAWSSKKFSENDLRELLEIRPGRDDEYIKKVGPLPGLKCIYFLTYVVARSIISRQTQNFL